MRWLLKAKRFDRIGAKEQRRALMPIVPADTGAAAAIDIAHTIAALLHNHQRRSIRLRTITSIL
jgi:hypothetical protein